MYDVITHDSIEEKGKHGLDIVVEDVFLSRIGTVAVREPIEKVPVSDLLSLEGQVTHLNCFDALFPSFMYTCIEPPLPLF